jgi:hypothetical protein
MAQAGNIYIVATNSRADFTATLAQNAALTLRKSLGAGFGGRLRLRSVAIVSAQNLGWEVQLYRTSNAYNIPPGGTIDNINFAGKVVFVAADGVQIAAAGSYFYYIDGKDIQYHDLDSVNAQLQPIATAPPVDLSPYLNLVLINRSATGKNADDAGAISIRLGFEATNA